MKLPVDGKRGMTISASPNCLDPTMQARPVAHALRSLVCCSTPSDAWSASSTLRTRRRSPCFAQLAFLCVSQDAWAKYFSRFISAYKSHGIDVWGVTVQNEPEAAVGWEACLYTPDFMASFVRDHLGPTLANDHPNVKIIGCANWLAPSPPPRPRLLWMRTSPSRPAFKRRLTVPPALLRSPVQV
eukprot:scaffold110355_cov31-Tisochrysis_lutea.AAC.8